MPRLKFQNQSLARFGQFGGFRKEFSHGRSLSHFCGRPPLPSQSPMNSPLSIPIALNFFGYVFFLPRNFFLLALKNLGYFFSTPPLFNLPSPSPFPNFRNIFFQYHSPTHFPLPQSIRDYFRFFRIKPDKNARFALMRTWKPGQYNSERVGSRG